MKRHLVLPPRGALLVSTDVHGSGEDFARLTAVFEAMRADDRDAHWAILGDIVHAPSEGARRDRPDLYDYPDASGQIAQSILELRARHPGFVHFVLGNHDYGHVGGPRTSKFYPDEVAHLEARLDDEARAALHRLCHEALLAVVAPCGALLAHGSPDDTLRALEDLDGITLPHDPSDAYRAHVLRSFLTSYGQPRATTERLLAALGRSGPTLTMVIHGHDRAEDGWFVEGDNQLCPVLFGAPRANKRYVVLDLAARYASVRELRDGHEIRRLYG